MRPLPAALLGFVVGAASLGAAWSWFGTRSGPGRLDVGSRSVTDERPDPPGTAAPGDVAERLERIEHEIGRLTDEVTRLGAPRVQARPEAATDATAVAEALAELEAEREASELAALTDAQLLAEVRRQRTRAPLEARSMVEELLRRALSDEDRASALTYLALLQRRDGEPFAAIQSLQDALASATTADARSWASYELAMTLSEGGDDTGALAILDRLPAAPDVSRWNRLHAEWAVATLAERTGDVPRARALFEKLLEDTRTDDEFDWLTKKVEGQLAAL